MKYNYRRSRSIFFNPRSYKVYEKSPPGESLEVWGLMLWFACCVAIGVYGHVKHHHGFYFFFGSAIVSAILMGMANYYYNTFRERCAVRRRMAMIREKNFPYDIEQVVIAGKVRPGMTAEQVKLSWGKPKRIERNVDMNNKYETWFYSNSHLRFSGEILTFLSQQEELEQEEA